LPASPWWWRLQRSRTVTHRSRTPRAARRSSLRRQRDAFPSSRWTRHGRSCQTAGSSVTLHRWPWMAAITCGCCTGPTRLPKIGARSVSKDNSDTKSVHQSADVFVSPKTNEAFVADGYGNRRVIVFDADTGVFKRMWGAFSNQPIDVAAAARGGAGAAGARGG